MESPLLGRVDGRTNRGKSRMDQTMCRPVTQGRRVATALLSATALAVSGCAYETAEESMDDEPVTEAPMISGASNSNAVIALLEDGLPVFGMFAPEMSESGGQAAAANQDTDFIFYSLESGPWDIPTMETFIASMGAAAGEEDAHPVTLRIPPVRDDRARAVANMVEGLGAGVDGLVLPHVETVDDVAAAVEAAGDRLWPLHADGDVLTVILIEDQAGIERARDLVSAPGVGVAIPGPGDLARAYDRDMEAVEAAIQTVLAACKEFDVPCGITAGPDDIAMRLEQGFRMIIVTQAEALGVGLAAAGRSE